jgi:hypothetical protein
VSTVEELLERSSGPENVKYGRKDLTLTMWHPLSAKVDINFAEKRRSLGRYSSLADSGHGVYFLLEVLLELIYTLKSLSILVDSAKSTECSAEDDRV